MKTSRIPLLSLAAALLLLPAAGQQAPASKTATQMRRTFTSVNQKILTMAKDFPEDKYDFRLKPEMRSFGEVMIHIVSGNVYSAKAGRGEKASWDEEDPKKYKSKAEIVAFMEKAIADSEAVIKQQPDSAFANSLQPWLAVTEHSAEHYGLLVAYYRANGIVPPESRPKK